MTDLITTRDVTRQECHWLDADVPAGTAVYRYHGPTYGCIGPTGVAVTSEPDTTPFFELPRSALISEKANTRAIDSRGEGDTTEGGGEP